MRKKLCICLAALLLAAGAQAQDSIVAPVFKPTGAPVVRIETNYRYGLGNANNQSGFAINRAYIGYDYKATKDWRVRTVVDAAVPAAQGSKRNDVYLKNAVLIWSREKTIVNIGLIPLMETSIQERWWGYRHVLKTVQDVQGMGPSADLGVSIQQKIAPWASLDFALYNGEGYKTINSNESYRYALGATLNPSPNWLIRPYIDLYTDSEDLHTPVNPTDTSLHTTLEFTHEYTYALFVGYKNQYMNAGAEYAIQQNHKLVKGRDIHALSIFSTYFPTKKMSIWGRYDYVVSKDVPNYYVNWNKNNGHLAALGFEYRPNKHFKITPNIRHYQPGSLAESKQFIHIDVEFDL